MNKMVYIMSLMGNNGTFNKPMRTKLQDKETMYHIFYLVICLSGMCIHPFFYSLLVSIFMSVECWHGHIHVSYNHKLFFLFWSTYVWYWIIWDEAIIMVSVTSFDPPLWARQSRLSCCHVFIRYRVDLLLFFDNFVFSLMLMGQLRYR